MNQHCQEHSGISTSMEDMKGNIYRIWSAIDKQNDNINALAVKLGAIIGAGMVIQAAILIIFK